MCPKGTFQNIRDIVILFDGVLACERAWRVVML
jgi:hypothetical protein